MLGRSNHRSANRSSPYGSLCGPIPTPPRPPIKLKLSTPAAGCQPSTTNRDASPRKPLTVHATNRHGQPRADPRRTPTTPRSPSCRKLASLASLPLRFREPIRRRPKLTLLDRRGNRPIRPATSLVQTPFRRRTAPPCNVPPQRVPQHPSCRHPRLAGVFRRRCSRSPPGEGE